jgi:hypothetical protein
MEQGAAPAGAGLTWSCALGRLWGTARRALRPGCEELADGTGTFPPEKRGLEPERTPRSSAGRRARFIRARGTSEWFARQRIAPGVNIRLVRRSALLLPSFAEGPEVKAYPAPYKQYGR